MKPNYKKQAKIGKYTICICDDNSVEVLINDEPYGGQKKPLLRDEIAPIVHFEVDPMWNTQQLGNKLVDAINSSKDSQIQNCGGGQEEDESEFVYHFHTIGYEDEDRSSCKKCNSREEVETAINDFIVSRSEEHPGSEFEITEGHQGYFELRFDDSTWWYKMWIEKERNPRYDQTSHNILKGRKNNAEVSEDGWNPLKTYLEKETTDEDEKLIVNGKLIIPRGLKYISREDLFSDYNVKRAKLENITSVEIPDSVTSIGAGSFKDCKNLTSVVIPPSVTVIEICAFQNCIKMTSIVLPSLLKQIGRYAFLNCSSLTNVDVPNSVAMLEAGAFANCKNLKSMVIPSSVKIKIEEETFAGCSSLTYIELPDSLIVIRDKAFYKCTSLTDIVFPESVKQIGKYVFAGCTGLTNIKIPSVKRIDVGTFKGCSGLTTVIIPSSVESIEDEAFADCASLTNLVIPPSVKKIGHWAFARCENLTSVVIPDTVCSITHEAFLDCENLKYVKIPDWAYNYLDGIFSGCTALNSGKE